MPKHFKSHAFHQVEIFEDGRLDCTIRFNPGSLMYSAVSEPDAWYTLTLKQFADFAMAQGRKKPRPGPAKSDVTRQ